MEVRRKFENIRNNTQERGEKEQTCYFYIHIGKINTPGFLEHSPQYL